MGTVKTQTRLFRRGSQYYFRARVPVDLLADYAPRKEITFSLKTSDKQEALRLTRVESVRLDDEFAAKRRHAKRDSMGTASPLPQSEIDRLTALWASMALIEDEQERIDRRSWTHSGALELGMELLDDDCQNAIATGNTLPIQGALDSFLKEQQIKLPKNSESYRRLAYGLAKGVLSVHEAIRARNSGKIIKGGAVPAHSSETLSSLYDYWKGQQARKPRTLLEFDTAVKRFNKLHGDTLPASAIEKGHLVEFKDSLLERGLAQATVIKQLAALRAVLQLAANNDKLKSNPATGVRLPKAKTKEKARLSFSPSDLGSIFGSPVFTQGKRPAASGAEAAFWIPLLALFTGARLGELGQLHAADIKTLDRCTFIEITDEADSEGEARSIKTESSRRRVPVHPELTRCGFLEYVEQVRAQKAQRLFPGIIADSAGRLTGNWSKWFSRYLRETVGIMDRKKTFHSLRHSFKDACREADIREEIHDALTGHSSASVGRSYGGESFPLKPLAGAMARVKYHGLDLSHLHIQEAA